MNPDTQIQGLKYQVARQVGMKKSAIESLEATQIKLIQSWVLLLKYSNSKSLVQQQIWDYVLDEYTFVKNVNSSHIGIKSRIAEYTNKKGLVSLAHFTHYGHYLNSVNVLGPDPVFYTGNFQACPEWFVVDFEKLSRPTLIAELGTGLGYRGIGYIFIGILAEPQYYSNTDDDCSVLTGDSTQTDTSTQTDPPKPRLCSTCDEPIQKGVKLYRTAKNPWTKIIEKVGRVCSKKCC